MSGSGSVTTHAFPALGFDPAPGDPDDLTQLAAHCRQLSAEIADDADRLRSLRGGWVWEGPAAQAFRRRLEDVPRDLDRTAQAYQEAAGAVGWFADELRIRQVHAADLEHRAAVQQQLMSAADATELVPGCALTPRQQAEDAWWEVVAAARGLRRDVLDDARHCNRLLHDATRHAPKPPGWFSRVVSVGSHLAKAVNHRIGEFVRAHAGLIAGLAGVCSKISSALAVVAMLVGPVPVLGQAVVALAGPAALLTAGIALAGHTALAVYAGGSWTPVLLDVAALATGAAPRGVESVAGKWAAAKGVSLGEEAIGMRAAVTTLRSPGQALAGGAQSTMTFPGLVTRTISYQFDLAAGGLGTFDLAQSGRLGLEVREAREHAETSVESEKPESSLRYRPRAAAR